MVIFTNGKQFKVTDFLVKWGIGLLLGLFEGSSLVNIAT